MKKREVLSVCVAAFVMLSSVMVLGSVSQRAAANPGILYVDATGVCGGNSPCYLHPQDAVNDAGTEDTILVYPGTYGYRKFTDPVPPHWNPGDQYAPALIVWKDDLTIKAIDGPSATTIETTYDFWVNPALPGGGGYTGGGGSIEHSTGCEWNYETKVWDGDCVRPKFGTAPNAVAIISSGVTIEGFTLRSPSTRIPNGGLNQAGVMIGGLYAGYGEHGETLSAEGNTVRNNVFKDVWQAVYIWHSNGNSIIDNTVEALGNTGHWAGISIYDGYSDAQINLGHPSTNNYIVGNKLVDKGIALGAWAPPTWTSLAGSKVCCNTVAAISVTYANGPVVVACNKKSNGKASDVSWDHADYVIVVQGIVYKEWLEAWTDFETPIFMKANLKNTGTEVRDRSGFEVTFNIYNDERQYGPFSAVTNSEGKASTLSGPVKPGIYTVKASVTPCDDCTFSSTETLMVGWIVQIDIRPDDYPNYLNLKARKSTLPVAVLTTDKFDAATVNPSTVTFEGASPTSWKLTDVDGDGDLDMLFHFLVGDITGLHPGDTSGTLTGKTLAGIPLMGTDTIIA